MPYITREDGEHFVIPSYRDVLTAKNKNQLKKDILMLSSNYGEYITLQRKSAAKYEVAFSPDTGYLLGESIWHQFKRPVDMVYCEAIPNTNEAILVIVKAGSVYLDGSFPIESIPEELVIFLTQENNFEIYTYGDVPISQVPTDGKFSFEASSVKSFTVLDKPVFPNLPLLKIYQLQLLDPVLKANGIGTFPTGAVITAIIILGLCWMLWSFISERLHKVTVVKQQKAYVNPYTTYLSTLNSPTPTDLLYEFSSDFQKLLTLPGWHMKDMTFASGSITVTVESQGGTTADLYQWASNNNFNVLIANNGFALTTMTNSRRRPISHDIYPMNQIIGTLVDKIATVYPGNVLSLGDFKNMAIYQTRTITVRANSVTPLTLTMIGDQLKDLPLVLINIKVTVDDVNNLTGSIILEALGK